MANSALVLLKNNFKSWVSARGFIMVIAASLVPLVLTGAWVATHQVDVASDAPQWEPNPPVEGQKVNITAVVTNKGRFDVGEFNASLTVGRVSTTSQGVRLVTDSTNATKISGLKSGESETIRMNWTARTGFFVVLSDADTANALGEIEEFNNQKPVWMEVRYKTANESEKPNAPSGLGGPAGVNKTADLSVVSLDWEPAEVHPNDNVTFSVVVRNDGPQDAQNANVTVQVGQVFSNQLFASKELKANVSLGPGQSETVTMTWNQVPPGPYWAQAYVNLTDATDANTENNHLAKPFTIHIRVGEDAVFPDAPEKLTIKRFYLDILNILHIRILLPLIGLFYAAGVLSDEKEKGNLVYLLTRPVPRPLIPITKFVASFLVAAVAVIVGILGTFFLLLGTPEGNIGFLTTPLLISLISLFVYGSFFIMLGVLVDRPYLIGLAWVIGWETIAGNFVPWVRNLTLSHHLINAINGWRLDAGLQWLPESQEAKEALMWVMGAAVSFLVISVLVMRRREFDV